MKKVNRCCTNASSADTRLCCCAHVFWVTTVLLFLFMAAILFNLKCDEECSQFGSCAGCRGMFPVRHMSSTWLSIESCPFDATRIVVFERIKAMLAANNFRKSKFRTVTQFTSAHVLRSLFGETEIPVAIGRLLAFAPCVVL